MGTEGGDKSPSPWIAVDDDTGGLEAAGYILFSGGVYIKPPSNLKCSGHIESLSQEH